ncbi:osmoprotectant transport system permease protein [Curtobacterium sp. PhB130]|uniref:ABC transporter permease n=1 Tax=unclassified Curtobacterium TaxID=257496 RepID=UPI000FA2E85B|nr:MULTISPECIES: ABC transporter permease [unclassified Curtobacterium]ROP63409.1 osmoprotectant transport system permease protein [Curtobacterium sp. ZW137]ROS77674.1 osmoprotectant transport system permease protein [Curtobacterium sp. PhB130]TCK66118.1 osmoprotectant transport system permease protein [Curtobacterium sp. PhB136]
MTDVVTEPRVRPARSASWKPLVIQPVAILVVLGAFAIWLATADLTATERSTLNPADLLALTWQHVLLTIVSTLIVLVIGIPLGIVLTRGPLRRASGVILAVANFGQAAPAVGLVVLLAFWLGFSFWAAVIALVLYAILPVLRNTIIGIESVDSRLVEAGRGMGMSAFAVLLRVELPLAVPVMLSGIRTALVLLVGSAALATFIGAGGLGLLITTGVNLFLPKVLVSGALLIALLALSIDWIGRIVETVARPKGLR